MKYEFHRAIQCVFDPLSGRSGVVAVSRWRLPLHDAAEYFSWAAGAIQPQTSVGDDGIDCRYCHTAWKLPPLPAIPPTKTCMNCHSVLFNNAAYLEPIRESYRSDKSIQWVKVTAWPISSISITAFMSTKAWAAHVPRADQSNAAGVPGQHIADAMVRGMSCNPERVSARKIGFQYGLEGPTNQAEVGAKLREEYKISDNGRAHSCRLSSLMDGMRSTNNTSTTIGRRCEAARWTDGFGRRSRQAQSKTGKQYWRTLEELAGDPQFAELLHREFPRQAPSEWDDSVTARFPEAEAASLAFAGLSGCAARRAVRRAVRQAARRDVSASRSFMPQRCRLARMRSACWWRATKGGRRNRGNPDHPSSLGATNVFAQASV